jgi:hypothetical protein
MTNLVQASSTSPGKSFGNYVCLPRSKFMFGNLLLGAIPCHGVLANRHMITSSECPLCTSDCEIVRHALFLCPTVREVWRLLGLESMITEIYTAEGEGGSVLADFYFFFLRKSQPQLILLPEESYNPP